MSTSAPDSPTSATTTESALGVTAPPEPGPGIHRHLTMPPGARKLSFDDCAALDNTLPLFMSRTLFAAPTRAVQMGLLQQLVDGAEKYGITPALRERKAWLDAGYGEKFATVHDIDTALVYLRKIQSAAERGDLDAMPALYTPMATAIAQLAADTQDKFCNS